MANFGDIRSILQHPASQQTWERLAEGLQSWYGREPIEKVLEYSASCVEHWPAELPTFAPKAWFKRDASVVKKDPITAFFIHCFMKRTDIFFDQIRAELEEHKPLKIPSFIDTTKLGELRWKNGEALDEKAQKRVITWMRHHCTTLGDEKLERLRQFLDDEDCQRWSRQIYKDWVGHGEASSHKWALYQIAYWGTEDDLNVSSSKLRSMASSKWARANQYIDITQAFGSKKSFTTLADTALSLSDHYSVRSSAAHVIATEMKARDMTAQRFLATETNYQKWLEDALMSLYLGAPLETYRHDLERALGDQLEIPGWVVNLLLDEEQTRGDLRLIVFKRGDDFFRVADGKCTQVDGTALDMDDGDFITLAHPLHLNRKEIEAWLTLLKDEQQELPFAQLEREVYGMTEPLMPAGGIRIVAPYGPGMAGLESGAPQDAGCIWSFGYVPSGRLMSLWFDASDYWEHPTGEVGFNRNSRLESVDARSRLGNDSRLLAYPVLRSELCRTVRQLATVIEDPDAMR
tara:strand:+ start:317 stop:1870 length:1554 start_codon:yes stop_codon:yes gene_type:complete